MDQMRSEKIVVCVCTCQRPVMLRHCLTSLIRQDFPDWLRMEIVVVDNDWTQSARDTVQDMKLMALDTPIHYAHEPKRGIAFARNAALDSAVLSHPDWIAFIDDDETAKTDWIAQLTHPDYADTPILRGSHQFRHPSPRPFWALQKPPRQGREGQACKTATTGNVRFAAAIVHAGFRFDERLGFMGGEDNEFFTRLHKAGYVIKWTERAKVTEYAHPERFTYLAQCYRAYWAAASDLRALAIARGWGVAAVMRLHTIPLHVAVGALWLLASPFCLLAGVDVFKRAALKGGRTIAKGLGRAAAFLGMLPEPYRVIHGK